MIPDKQRKDHHEMTLLLQTQDNDLCNQFNKLDLKNSESSGNNNFTKSKDEIKRKNKFEANVDAVNEIEEKLNNIKIFHENDVSANSDKLKNTFSTHEFNIVCDNFQNANEFENKYTRSIQDQNVCDDSNSSDIEKQDVNYTKEQNIEEREEVKKVQNDDNNINDNQNDLHEESEKSEKNGEGLRSRGPIYMQKFSQSSYQPYNRGTWTSNSINSHSAFFSGGEVLHVTEPMGQPTPVTSYQEWNDIPNYNIIQNDFEETNHHTVQVPLCTSISANHVVPVTPITPVGPIAPIIPVAPVTPIAVASSATPAPATVPCSTLSEQTSYSPVSAENEVDAVEDEALIKAIWNQYPIIRVLVKECNNNTETKSNMSPEPNWDEGLPRTPSTLERSPPASPCESLQHPPPPASEKDSGTDSPQPLVGDMSDDSLHSLPGEMKRTEIWVEKTQQRPVGQGCRIILPKLSIKARFKMILDPDRKLQAWAKIQSNNDSCFLKGDADGDTQLMIAVSNEYEGQLELIYAMVERMRKIPNSLNVTNNAGDSALYLACKVLNKQPLVAAYIAEALIEQNVNVADLRYENGLTLPEILENEGSTHDAVLKELLALKNKCGKFVFPVKNQNELNFKVATENYLNLQVCV